MPKVPTPARLEAFSDGVIAVIITIMVLDLHVPQADGPAGLRTLAPTLAIYLLSFVFTGIYWVNHQHLVDRVDQVNSLILWANLFLLFALSLLPFSTAYMIAKHFDSFAIFLYALSLLFAAVTFQALSVAIGKQLHRSAIAHPNEHTGEEFRQHQLEAWKGWFSFGAYIAGAALAFSYRWLALTLLACVTLIWIIPSFGTRKAIRAS